MSVDLAQLYKANDKKRVYIRTDKNGTKYFADYTCKRCGGQGGLPQWTYTGYTCYECGGTGVAAKPDIYKEYTPEYAAKLEERRNALSVLNRSRTSYQRSIRIMVLAQMERSL